MATTAGTPPGSGANFAALKGKLAARGAHDPGALAAWIGRRKYGRKGFAKLSAHGRSHSHSNSYGFAVDGEGDNSHRVTHAHDGGGYHTHDFSADHDYARDNARGIGAAGTSSPSSPEALRTPQRSGVASTGYSPQSTTVRTGPGGAGLANGRRGIELSRRMPVRQYTDLVVARAQDGSSVIRHRQGGTDIGTVRRGSDGTYQPVTDGQALSPHNTPQAAIKEMIGVYNRNVAAMPLSRPPAQTPLMDRYGITNVRAFADADNDNDNDDSASGDTDGDFAGNPGLTPRGKMIYKKLRGKGVAPAVALAMAKRSQNTTPGQFGQKAS